MRFLTLMHLRQFWVGLSMLCLGGLLLARVYRGESDETSKLQAACSIPSSSKHYVIQIPPILTNERADLDQVISVRNDTKRRVKFTGIRPSCSCAGAKLARMELEAGEDTTLRFQIDLRNRTGPQRFVCHLLEDGGIEWVYEVETTLYEQAKFARLGSTHFGMVDPNAQETRESQFCVYANSIAGLPSALTFASTHANLRIEQGLPQTTLQPDGIAVRTVDLKLRLRAPPNPGFTHAVVSATFESRGQRHHVDVGVDWNVRTRYSVTPPQVYFGTTNPTSPPVERLVIVRRTDNQALKITALKSSTAAVQCAIETERDESVRRLVFVLDPTAVARAFVEEVIVEIDDPVQPSLKIPLAALPKSQD